MTELHQLRRTPDVEVDAVVHLDQLADLLFDLGFTDAFVDEARPLLEMLPPGPRRAFGEVPHHMFSRCARPIDVESETFIRHRQYTTPPAFSTLNRF